MISVICFTFQFQVSILYPHCIERVKRHVEFYRFRNTFYAAQIDLCSEGEINLGQLF